VHTSAKARLASVAMFIGPLPTFRENFVQICSEVFAQNISENIQ